METLVFQVELLGDVVLPATSNTQGNIEPLDLIPGSNFLGMVAALEEYDKFDNSFDVFHSGKVRFGDATPLIRNSESYKMPLVYFYEKLDEEKVINQLHTNLSTLKQAKQHRQGYITKDLDLVYISYGYAQKSAYEKAKRKSKEGKMFGYTSMPKGMVWQFSIKYNGITDEDKNRIIKNIIGKKRLGKSKSAQYGEVYITQKGSSENIENIPNEENISEVVLYAKSRLSLVDENGNPTYNLKYLEPTFKNSNIDWSKSQIRISSYTRYDGTRKYTDSERVVINSGSVVILKDISQQQLQNIRNGVGAYLSEGFGEVLINPSFLTSKENIVLNEVENDESIIDTKVPIKDDTARFLMSIESNKKAKLDLADSVRVFIDNHYKSIYENINKAQWGKIRSICNSAVDNPEADIRKYITSGKAKWSENQVNLLLPENKEFNLEFVKLLSIDMPKEEQDD